MSLYRCVKSVVSLTISIIPLFLHIAVSWHLIEGSSNIFTSLHIDNSIGLQCIHTPMYNILQFNINKK
jgi:hypothetical protein